MFYSYALMELEQFGQVNHEVVLLQNFTMQGGQAGETPAASIVAASTRLFQLAQARKLLHDAAGSGGWNLGTLMILQARGHQSPLLSVTPETCPQIAKTCPDSK